MIFEIGYGVEIKQLKKKADKTFLKFIPGKENLLMIIAITIFTQQYNKITQLKIIV